MTRVRNDLIIQVLGADGLNFLGALSPLRSLPLSWTLRFRLANLPFLPSRWRASRQELTGGQPRFGLFKLPGGPWGFNYGRSLEWCAGLRVWRKMPFRGSRR